MPEIYGNSALISEILGAIKNGKLSGTYLFEGRDGSGKRTLARYFAAALFCQNKNSRGEPCLSCRICRNIFAGSHIDVNELKPEDGVKTVSVEQVREFLKKGYVLPAEGDWRVFILPDAQLLRKGAQNALLKSIEEVRPRTVYFILTTDRSKILPTVRSRAVPCRMEPLPPELLEKVLRDEGFSEENLILAVLLSGGSLGLARKIAGDENYLSARNTILSYFRAIFEGKGFSRLCILLSPNTVKRDQLSLYFGLIKSALRDLITCRETGETCGEFFTDPAYLSDFSSILNPAAAVECFHLADEILQANDLNANIFSSVSYFHLKAQALTRHTPLQTV